MNKKFFSKFAVLTLVVGIFGYLLPTVLAAPVSRTATTDVGNNVPTFTTVTDGPSYDADGFRSFVGDNITFSATIHDDNKDGVYLAICKAAGITEGAGSAAPTCTNGTWAVSTLAASDGSGNSAPSVTYTVAYADVTSPMSTGKAWFAYACDNNASATSCSSVSQGSGNAGSPFVADDHIPVFSGNVTDSSDATTPTNEGTDVTFSGTATDTKGNSWYLAVCKTDSVTPGSDAAPTCAADQTLCVDSTEAASGAASSCTWSTTGNSAQSQVWYAFACDKTAAVGGGRCSPSNSVNSPLKINHRPVIGTITAGPSYGSDASVDPGNGTGGQVFFRIGVTDPDTDTTQDTIDAYICNAATTSFDPATGACTGGTLIGSTLAVATGTNADNNTNTLVPIPTAHATIGVKIYLRDSHLFADAGTSNAKNYSITDVAPAVGNYTVNNISPIAGSSVVTSFTVNVTDNNGDNDVTTVNGYIYDDNAINLSSGTCTPAEKNCYQRNACTLSGVGGGTDVNLVATCDNITTWYNIDPTTPGLWKAHVNAIDQTSTTIGADSATDITVDTLSAVAISEGSIPYSAVSPNAASAAVSTTTQNAGNIVIDVGINGTDMTSGGNTIIAAQQHWTNLSTWTWGTGDFALITGAVTSTGNEAQGCSNTSNAVRTDHTSGTGSDVIRYWKIFIPVNTPTGSYSGTNTFTSIANTCTGTY